MMQKLLSLHKPKQPCGSVSFWLSGYQIPFIQLLVLYPSSVGVLSGFSQRAIGNPERTPTELW
ncbi:MAG: hypothetical protein Q8926_18160, partial [Bacteroidota bacterium]|nr:hypothetical protein [Bacteroidota bacterium]